MIDLAEARGKYDATGFMDALDTNLDVLNDSEKVGYLKVQICLFRCSKIKHN